MFLRRLLNLSFVLLVISLLDISTPVSPSFACDSCAELAIKQGFARLNEQANLIKKAIDQLNKQVGQLKDQISDSGSETVSAIDDFSDSLRSTLTENNDKLVEALSGLYVQVGNQFSMMNEANKKYFLEFQNDVATQFAATEKIIRSRNQLYEAGGELGNFRGGDITDSLIMLYTSNSDFAKAIYAINSKFITRWNDRDRELIQNGRSALFSRLSARVTSKADELLSTLNTQSILTNEQYQDLVYYVAFGINPNQIDPLDGNYLNMVSRQSVLLMDIIAKAPIIPLSEKNVEFLGEFLPAHEDSCPELLVEKGMIPSEDVVCTSLDAILSTLVLRSSSPNWMIASNIASKRALAEEELRSQVIANILQKRLLDSQRARNVIISL